MDRPPAPHSEAPRRATASGYRVPLRGIPHPNDEDGQIAFTFVITILAVFVLLGFSLDAGLWYFDHRTAQNQADAAVLGAIQEMPHSDDNHLRDVAFDWLEKNGAARASVCDEENSSEIWTHFLDGVAFRDADNDGEWDAIRVCVRRDSPVVFAALARLSNAQIGAAAAAAVDEIEEPFTYALMAMNPTLCETMRVNGNPVINLLDDGASYTRSTCAQAMRIEGNPPRFNADGGHDVVGGCGGFCAPPQTNPAPTQVPYDIPDPFADYPQPIPNLANCQSIAGEVINGIRYLNAGTYCQPLELTGGTTVLRPGTFIFTQGVMVHGSAVLTSNDPASGTVNTVIVFMTCRTGLCESATGADRTPMQAPGCTNSATFCVQGNQNSSVDIVGPGPDAPPSIVLWVDRHANAVDVPMIRIAGQGDIAVHGNMYAISGTVNFEGQGSGENRDLTGTIVADKIHFGGGATYDVRWDADLSPRPSTRVYTLVE